MPEWLKNQYQTLSQGAMGTVMGPDGKPKGMDPYGGNLQAPTNEWLQDAYNRFANTKSPDYATVNKEILNSATALEGNRSDPFAIKIGTDYSPERYQDTQFNAPRVQFEDTLAGWNPQAAQGQAAQAQGGGFQSRDYNFTSPQVQAQQVQAQQLGRLNRGDIRDVSGPGLQDYLVQKASDMQVNAPQLQQYQMQQPKDVAAERLDPAKQWTDQGIQQSYMDPYAQAVTDINRRKATEVFQQQLADAGTRAAASGAMGGSRQAILEGSMRRDYATQQGDIQAQGLENAYQNAQQQFERDRAAGFQSGAFNAQTGLQAGLANQQMGYNTGVQNLQSNLQTQGLGSAQNMQAQLANAQNAKEIAFANQQAQLGRQSLGASLGQQANLANQQADVGFMGLGSSRDVQNQQATLAAAQGNQRSSLAADQGNQSTGMQGQIAGAQLGSQERQFGAGQQQALNLANAGFEQQANTSNADRQMQAQQMKQQALTTQYGGNLQAGTTNAGFDQWAQQAAEQSKQFGFGQFQQGQQQAAQFDLTGQQATQNAINSRINTNLALEQQRANMYQTVGNNDTTQFRNDLAVNQQLANMGQNRQSMDQRGAELAYQDWMMHQQAPMMQMQQLAGILGQTSAPFSTNVSSQMQRQPSIWQGIGGALLSAAPMAFGMPPSGGLGGLFGGGGSKPGGGGWGPAGPPAYGDEFG